MLYGGFMKKENKAFTLIEMLIVVAIIGILSTVIFISATTGKNRSRVAKAVSDIDVVKKAVGLYKINTGFWPISFDSNTTKANNPLMTQPATGASGWGGPYLDSVPKHPWKGAIRWGFGDHGVAGTGSTGDGSALVNDGSIILDDDGSANDNAGVIPNQSMIEIDSKLDNGALNSGLVRGVQSGGTTGSDTWNAAIGEISISAFPDACVAPTAGGCY